MTIASAGARLAYQRCLAMTYCMSVCMDTVCVAEGLSHHRVGRYAREFNQWTGWAASAFGTDDVHVWVFVWSFVIGYSLSRMITMGVVKSAVDAVIVCFAEAPNEF